MGHWAKIGDDSKVIQVVVADDDKQAWLTEALGGNWVQTSYNTHGGIHYTQDKNGYPTPSDDQTKALRKNYASIGYTYDQTRDAFIPPKPSEDATLDEATCLWVEIVEPGV